MKETRKGMLLVISGPSGTGKGTLAAKLLRDDPSFAALSVSVTTRANRKRSNEIEDVHYHFLSDEEYDKLLAEDAFLEHATVHWTPLWHTEKRGVRADGAGPERAAGH